MNFGMVEYLGLDQQSFLLPAPQGNFSGTVPVTKYVHVGFPRWTDGIVLPNRLPEKNSLIEYAKKYDSIELNASHYKIYSEDQIKNWVKKIGGNKFLFCPKMYKGITNFGGLTNKDKITAEFLKEISCFEKHLGPSFIQVNELSPGRSIELFTFLMALPAEFQFFLDIHHPDWFSVQDNFSNLFNQLRELNIGLVITDTPGRRDIVHSQFPVPKAFVRFNCIGDHELDFFRIEQWKTQFEKLFKMGLQEAYFFLHVANKDDQLKIDFAKYVNHQFNNI